jgi:hypothetical protein
MRLGSAAVLSHQFTPFVAGHKHLLSCQMSSFLPTLSYGTLRGALMLLSGCMGIYRLSDFLFFVQSILSIRSIVATLSRAVRKSFP